MGGRAVGLGVKWVGGWRNRLLSHQLGLVFVAELLKIS